MKAFIRAFLEGFFRADSRRFILGINAYAESVFGALRSRGLGLEAFVDDFTKETSHHGVPIIRTQDLGQKSGYVVVVVSCNTKTALEKLESLENFDDCGKSLGSFGGAASGAAGGANLVALDYFAFQRAAKEILGLDLTQVILGYAGDNLDGFKAHYNANKAAYDGLCARFADEKSKRHFRALCDFRTSQDYALIRALDIEPEKQYFDDFLELGGVDVFVDCGAFDGENSAFFAAANPNYERIFVFEPFAESLAAAKTRLRNERCDFFNLAVGEKKERLFLSLEADARGNNLCPTPRENSVPIELDALDSCIGGILQKMSNGGGHNDEKSGESGIESRIESRRGESKNSESLGESGRESRRESSAGESRKTLKIMIKMDIEGSEIAALKGAERIIKAHHPILAICVYHRFDDYLAIPALILSLEPRYRLFFRHHSFGMCESVMYFLPE